MIDCFKINKYQSIDENILYIGMNLYNILKRPQHIDVVFKKYSIDNNLELGINLERLLYLALTFLYSVGMIEISGKLLRRIR
ncbi:ABC-three component system middle component 6 [Clostridium tyrobutyricum]|uniref:ABC-three component system middle component 6 n=1 Tax=Clostridium tyrobutyricum TaxID=1519 RepID=UPI0010AAB4E6|nr:ABC-three component system middle component 6 [Clostridium tyrobutyricum]